MAWDTERTRRLLLEAATREFSLHGLAGGRVDRIAAAAGVNKERIYQYFGKKDEFFDTVLATALARSMDEVPIEGTGPAAIADYAGRLFDHHRADSALARLVFWEGLERGGTVTPGSLRAERCAAKVDAVLAVLPEASRTEAADLLLTIVGLCDSSTVLLQVDGLLAGTHEGRAAERREHIVRTVTLLAEAVSEQGARRR